MTSRRHLLTILTVLAVLVVPISGPAAQTGDTGVGPNPVATDEATYQTYGRVWSDPHGCLDPAAPGVSPWAKGNQCAQDHLTYEEVIAGGRFLTERFDGLVEMFRLDEALDDPELLSTGVAQLVGTDEDGSPSVLERERLPLWAFKVTDEDSTIPEEDRLHFVYSLSIHGLERQGIEGGIRAMEDLVTWAACEQEALADDTPACQADGPFPKPIVESDTPRPVPTAGEVLERSVIYFTLSNPDGWVAGQRGVPVDPQAGAADPDQTTQGAYTRGNGNGVDMNRDFPTIGYTYKPFSPVSEPEIRGWTEMLNQVKESTSAGRFAAGIDLHGMLDAVAFSYTLIGSGQRDFRKNAITVETSIRTWEDQTQRLCWSPYVADSNCNGELDDGEVCQPTVDIGTNGHAPACFADQWGTVLDTLGYTITGGFGDWMDSPLGLDGVGINNEMYVSAVFEPALVQTWIDGNKGLIYSQLSALLFEQDAPFNPVGRVGYVFDPQRLQVPAGERPANPGLPAQDDMDVLLPCSGEDACAGGTFTNDGMAPTFEFDVLGPADDVYNGGISVVATRPAPASQNAAPISLTLEVFTEDQWQTIASSNGLTTVVTANDPLPGRWRVALGAPTDLPVRLDIRLDPVEAEASPGQAPIDASSMDFFEELNAFVVDGAEVMEPVMAAEVAEDAAVTAAGEAGLDRYDTLIVTDDMGSREHVADELGVDADAYFDGLRGFAERGGNLVLTDAALAAAAELGIVPADAVVADSGVAGFYHFILDEGAEATYADPERYPLTDGIDLPGAAEGDPGRRQGVEPTPLGYTPNPGTDPTPLMPFVGIERTAWESGCGQEDCSVAATTGEGTHISYGEAVLGEGVVRIAGSLLPDPVFEPDDLNDHRFGVSDYALAYTGYAVFENLVDYRRADRAGGAAVVRHAGADRIQTAAAVARQTFTDGAETALLATAGDYADALVGAPLAAAERAPILLTDPSAVSSATSGALAALGVERVIILGGEAAVSSAVEAELQAAGYEVSRVSGPTRFATAAEVASLLGAGSGGVATDVVIAEGASEDPSRGWPDALSGAAAAAAQGRPVLLVTRDRVPDETAEALAQLATERITIVGGEQAVSASVADQLAADHEVSRLAGEDRYATSVLAADAAADRETGTVWLATGRNWPDALAGAAAAGARGDRLYLVDGLDVSGSPATTSALAELAATGELRTLRLLGGPAAISEEVAASVGGELE